MSYLYDPALLRIAGPDAAHFLDNLLTRNVADLAPGGVAYAGLLTPQGKVIADMFVWRDWDESFLLEPALARAGALLQRLRLYKLRAKVEIEDVTGSRRGSLQVRVKTTFADPGAGGILVAPDPRPPAKMERALAPRDLVGLVVDEFAPIMSAADVRTSRIEAGLPDLSEDAAPEELFALEALFEELGGVDFHKGCFVGQENVSRMKRRATTRRKLTRVRLSEPVAAGTPIVAGEAQLGDVRACAGRTAMALLRLDRAQEALDKGDALSAAGVRVDLDPPDWLIRPNTGGED